MVEAKEFCAPINDDSLQLSGSRTASPLAQQYTTLVIEWLVDEESNRTLNPGVGMLLEYKSPSIPSKVPAVGKKAKNEGCCQGDIPNPV